MKNKTIQMMLGTVLALVLACAVMVSPAEANKEEWIQLFNGKNLDGWNVKIRYHDLGDNFANTFRVEDGLMKVSYDGYDDFNETFGHIFYETPYSNYRLRIEYQFVGEQAKNGPGWAIRNSGAMLHCQDPASMTKDQDFPVSIEAQFLGGDGQRNRTTMNLCTPGTNVVMKEILVTRHCINAKSETYHGEKWVTVEMEVRGGETIRHIIDGKTVLQYDKPQYDPTDTNAKPLIKDGNLALASGYISLQSESHPIHFRKVELLPLD